jgi:hypothetical protein
MKLYDIPTEEFDIVVECVLLNKEYIVKRADNNEHRRVELDTSF